MRGDLLLLSPEFLVAGLAFVVLGVDLVLRRERPGWLAAIAATGLAGILVFTLVYLWGKEGALYNGTYAVDAYAFFFKAFFLITGIVIILMSVEYVTKHLTRAGEFYSLILFSIVAMMALAASSELLTAYISLELLSFCLYILASYTGDSRKSDEAGTKYILLGAFASALLLYGISLLYGVVGVTRFEDISAQLQLLQGTSTNPALIAAFVFILAGLGFKVAAVPFHMWAPDIYEGAPTPITAYLAVASKAAAFALLLRLFGVAFLPVAGQWQLLVALLAAITMTLGNLVAIAQRNFKRLLAYSSIGQVGYLLMGIAALAHQGSNPVSASHPAAIGIVFHLAGYAVTNLAVFMGVIAFSPPEQEDIPSYAGLARRSPMLAAVITVGLFSLAGMPFFAGFVTKFYLFTAAAQEGLLWLVALAILNSLISFYYYLVIVRWMYIEAPTDPKPLRLSGLTIAVLAVLLVGILAIGLYPAPLVEAISAATKAIAG